MFRSIVKSMFGFDAARSAMDWNNSSSASLLVFAISKLHYVSRLGGPDDSYEFLEMTIEPITSHRV
jgi:hypothetical protein